MIFSAGIFQPLVCFCLLKCFCCFHIFAEIDDNFVETSKICCLVKPTQSLNSSGKIHNQHDKYSNTSFVTNGTLRCTRTSWGTKLGKGAGIRGEGLNLSMGATFAAKQRCGRGVGGGVATWFKKAHIATVKLCCVQCAIFFSQSPD